MRGEEWLAGHRGSGMTPTLFSAALIADLRHDILARTSRPACAGQGRDIFCGHTGSATSAFRRGKGLWACEPVRGYCSSLEGVICLPSPPLPPVDYAGRWRKLHSTEMRSMMQTSLCRSAAGETSSGPSSIEYRASRAATRRWRWSPSHLPSSKALVHVMGRYTWTDFVCHLYAACKVAASRRMRGCSRTAAGPHPNNVFSFNAPECNLGGRSPQFGRCGADSASSLRPRRWTVGADTVIARPATQTYAGDADGRMETRWNAGTQLTTRLKLARSSIDWPVRPIRQQRLRRQQC